MSTDENYPRTDDVTYLLTLANRYANDEGRGKPKGFVIIVAESDGGFTHYIADPDDDVEWMATIGNLEVTKHTLMNTKLTWEPVNIDGTEYTEEELEAFMEEIKKEDDE